MKIENRHECIHFPWHIDRAPVMMTSSTGNIFRVTDHLCGEFTGPVEFPAQRPVTRGFDVCFDLRLNKRLSKQSWGWWFETLSRPLWHHCNVTEGYGSGAMFNPFLRLHITSCEICFSLLCFVADHYNDVILGAIASQITSLTIVYSNVNSDADQRKHPSSASLAFVRGIHRGSVNSPHKWPVTRKMFPFDDVIMYILILIPTVCMWCINPYSLGLLHWN